MRYGMLAGIFLLFTGCHSGDGVAKIRSIRIQPIAFSNAQPLLFVQKQLAAFFHCPVSIAPDASMPSAFQDRSKGERYSADSVLGWLGKRRNDSISILVGLTRKDIFITKRDAQGRIKEPASTYAVWGILGLGNCPGNVCIVSDARFFSSATDRYPHRLRTTVIHEVGHNLGLPHCQSPHCIMNDANEQIATVDSAGVDLCASCKKRLGAL